MQADLEAAVVTWQYVRLLDGSRRHGNDRYKRLDVGVATARRDPRQW